MGDDLTEPGGERRSVGRHLGAGAAFSVIADLGTLFAATGLSVALARTVGPSGNGTFALLSTTINIAVLVVSLGITAGITYEVSHRQWAVRSALASCLWMSFGLGLLGTAAALGFYALTRHSALHDVSPHLAIIAIAGIAPALLFQFITAILLGRDRYEGYASLLLVNAGVLLFGAVGLALAFGLTGALAGFTASMTITAVVGVWVASRPTRGAADRSDPGHARPASWYVRKALRFGLLSWPANLLQQANYHLDLLILGGYVAASHVGLYSVAVTVVQIAWILPHGIQTVLFPRAASLDAAARAGDLTAADTDAVMARAIRHTVALLVPSAVIVIALLFCVPVVYGHKFDETVSLGLILLPGVLMLGVGKVLSSVIAGRGRPRYNLYNGLMTCTVTVGLYFWLIPRYGEWGAAIASSISYTVTTLVATGFLIAVIEVPLSTVFIPTRGDMHNYVEALAALRRNYLRRGVGPPARANVRVWSRRSGLAADPQSQRRSVAVIPAWYPSAADPVSGTFVRDQAHAASIFNDVTVLFADEPSRDVRWLFTLEDHEEDGLRTIRINCRASSLPQITAVAHVLGILVSLRRLRREGLKVELLHAHVYRAAWTAVIVGSLTRKPVIATEHSSEFGASGITRSGLRRARIALRRANLVCPVSDSLRAQMENLGIRANYLVVPNTVDTNLFRPRSTPRDRSCPTRLITVAALIDGKGLTHLFDALAPLCQAGKRFRLDLVGEGPRRQQLEEHVKRLGLEGVITFHGYQPKPAVASIMRQADFLVLPSLAENLPVAVIEAMATGLPVVASSVGGVPELVNDATGLLVDPGDSSALRDAIEEMLERHSEYSATAIAATARDRYSLAAVGAVWRDLYEEVIWKRRVTDGDS